VFTPADKQGFATARPQRSPVWFTLGRTGMTEVFYPDLSTPAVRELQLIVSDGTGAPQRLRDVEVRTEQSDERSLTLRQNATGRGWSATLTYVTDPQRATVLTEVTLRSLTGRPLRALDKWTVTSTGPLSDRPYYLRLTKDGQPDRGTTYNLGDNNPDPIDQRAVVDPSFLDLVRLGIKPATDPVIGNPLAVIDKQLATTTPAGQFWHRFTNDGYGERADGGPWNVNQPDPQRTYGRLWPILTGERGEYDLLAGNMQSATQALNAVAATAGSAGMLPEQVWDDRPPAPDHAQPGTAATSATPLAWTHAQYIRLAWSIDTGHPIEQPTAVSCRYTGKQQPPCS
jgi:GH15 family glucan-1,4-alpha-glucosidase